jgi:transcription elongation factor Elf1
MSRPQKRAGTRAAKRRAERAPQSRTCRRCGQAYTAPGDTERQARLCDSCREDVETGVPDVLDQMERAHKRYGRDA